MRKIYFLLVMMVTGLFANAQVNHLVISQVYGGGGNASATYNRDFIEIFNPTGSSINLSGWSVQYGSTASASTTLTGTSSITTLTGTIGPGQYILIGGASGATGANLPTVDISGAINLAAANGKVWLVNSTTGLTLNASGCTSASVVDFIGYGTANCSEGSAASGPSNNTTSLQRNSSGCSDVDNNSTDFTISAVNPRNSASTANYCYPTKFVITSITPSSPTAGIGFDVTVQAQNAGNTAQNVLSNTSFTLTTNGNAGAIGGTTTGTVNAGSNTVTISGVTLASAGTGVTVTATRTSGDNLSAGTSATFTVLAGGGTPTKFAITNITPASPTAGSGFAITVQSIDNSNIPQNVTANTSFNLTTNGNAGTISGTTIGTIVAGTSSVIVSGIILSSGGNGANITATQTAGDPLSNGTSANFNVLAAASQLAFAGVPSSGTPGINLSSFTVEARRPDNSLDNTYTGNITVAKASGPGIVSGTTTVAAVAGVATFSDIQFDLVGSYTLTASAVGLTSSTSGSINISPLITAIYQHDFGTTTISTHPYTVAPPVFAANLSNSSWNNGASLWTSFGGSSGQAIASASISGSNPWTLTFNVAAGYAVSITSFNFWRQSSQSTNNWSMTINGISVGSGSIPTSGSAIGTTNVANQVSNLTGTVTVVLTFGGTLTGSMRIDDFTLNGYVLPIPTISSFTPTNGYTGSTVVITGTNFTGATSVTFGGTNAASFTVDNATQITATVGAGNTGVVSVTTPNGTGVSSGSFTYNGYITNANGNWNDGATWLGGAVPPSNSIVTINHTVGFDVTTTVNNLILSNGIISLGNNDLTVAGTITGGSATSFIRTNGTGTLTVNNITTGKTLPVGNAAYNPLLIENGSGHNWSARVIDGLTASPGYNTDKAVLLQWDITPSVNPPAGGADITFQFDQSAQVGPQFNTATSVQAWRNPLDAGWVTAGSPTAVTVVNGTTSTVKVTGLTGFSKYALSNIDGPLPVSLLSFSGYKDGSRNQLSWTTASEVNNRGFDVQRSVDGINYTSIGFVNSLAMGGNSNDMLSYRFTDNTPAGVKQYYRLRQEDLDGRSKLSNIIMINGARPTMIMLKGIYPNPASATAAMIIDAPVAAKLTVLLTDMAGRNLVQQIVNVSEGSNTVALNISSLQSGTYLVRVISETGEMLTGKLVKQ